MACTSKLCIFISGILVVMRHKWLHSHVNIIVSYAIRCFDLFEAEVEDEEKELEHSSLQERLDRELKELDRKLEQKEVKIFEVLAVVLGFLLYLY